VVDHPARRRHAQHRQAALQALVFGRFRGQQVGPGTEGLVLAHICAGTSFSVTWGRFFVHFFPWKINFRGKFRGISWKNDFSKLFPRKIQFFSQHFWGKIFREIFRGIFPGKNVRKIGPR
jgi:hypothetical protein